MPRICWPCCSVQGEWNATRRGAASGRRGRRARRQRQQRDLLGREHFGHVAGRERDARGLRRVARIVGEQVAVVAHLHAAAAAVITIAFAPASSSGHQASMLRRASSRAPACVVEVEAQRAAAAGAAPLRLDQRDADAVEHARRRRVDAGRQRRLHAAGEHQHAPRVARRRPRARRRVARAPWPAEPAGRKRPQHLAEAQRRLEQPASRQDLPAARRAAAVACRRRGARVSTSSRPMSSSRPYCTPDGTGGLAGAAGQAAVEVQAGLRRRRAALEHLLDQVDAAARAVELVAEQLVGRAGRGAEAAVHALAQDRVGLAAGGRVADEVGEMGLPSRNPGTAGRD